MNTECKNCHSSLLVDDKFCNKCGAQVVNERLTVKKLIIDFFENNLGWDNKFFRTLKTLIVSPRVLLKEYLDGTRKKYVPPLTFLIIGMTIALFLFSTFDEDYIRVSNDFNIKLTEWMADTIGGPYTSTEFQNKQLAQSEKSSRFMLRYFNILTILLLPLYSFLAFLIYRKPYGYGEHIVINSYLQGLSFFSTSLLFLLSLVTNPLVYFLNIVFLVLFYAYAYGKLYKLTIAQTVLKLFVFFGLLIGMIFLLFVLGVAVGYTLKVLE